jgi:amino acid transporter
MKLDWLLGKPLPSWEDSQERIGISSGIATFGLDALSSAAYGPEAALTLLIGLGAAGAGYLLPISLVILALLAVVTISYQQTILAYPNGGGSYIVASENLGARVGLVAAAALIVDYLLDVAVGISAGVGALVSAAPALQTHMVALCLGILALLTLVNLRGVREAGTAFVAPTYLFVGCLGAVIAIGVARSLAAGGHPRALIAPPHPAAAAGALGAVGAWLLIRSFAGGCTALTGIEAVSNGVPAFRDPAPQTARRTLGLIAVILAVLLAGIAYLVKAYGIVATPPGEAGYRSVLAMVTAAVVGHGWFYYVTIASILIILSLSANTAFAGFPRLCRLVADRGYLPSFFAVRGRRLVYTTGILVLAALAGALLVVFGGVTDRLIPLFAIGAFLAFTLSQAGMVVHWWRHREAHWRRNLVINGIGALATGITVCVVLVAKFGEGAWITVILIPGLFVFMLRVERQYRRIQRQIAGGEFSLQELQPPVAVVPIANWNRATQKALRFACMLASEVHVLHIHSADEPDPAVDAWQARLNAAAAASGRPAPTITVIESPYRFVIQPIVDFIVKQEREHPGREVAVVVPEVAAKHWEHFFLHNHYATALKARLLVEGERRTVVIDVPWYVQG